MQSHGPCVFEGHWHASQSGLSSAQNLTSLAGSSLVSVSIDASVCMTVFAAATEGVEDPLALHSADPISTVAPPLRASRRRCAGSTSSSGRAAKQACGLAAFSRAPPWWMLSDWACRSISGSRRGFDQPPRVSISECVAQGLQVPPARIDAARAQAGFRSMTITSSQRPTSSGADEVLVDDPNSPGGFDLTDKLPKDGSMRR